MERVERLERSIGIQEESERCVRLWVTNYWNGSNMAKIVGETESGKIKTLKAGFGGARIYNAEINRYLEKYGKKFGLTKNRNTEPGSWDTWELS